MAKFECKENNQAEIESTNASTLEDNNEFGDYTDDFDKLCDESCKNHDEYTDEDIRQLDENTIDEYFLPRAIDENGKKIDTETAAFYNPFSNQEDTNGEFTSDIWKPTVIKEGSILYQLSQNSDSKSSYFTDQETVESCTNPDTGKLDLDLLKQKLQIKDDNGEKIVLTQYTIDNQFGVKAAEGISTENEKYGEGQGHQYFIPYAEDLKKSGVLNKIEEDK